mgnify:CR=1 FL=1
MDSYTTLAHRWLESHPNPSSITDDPDRWAQATGEAIFQRIHQIVDQLAPPIPGEEYLDRLRRLNSAWQTATEVAIDEHLPFYDLPDEEEDWVPLMPDISDLL